MSAKEFLLAYLKENPSRPSDLEDDLCGGWDRVAYLTTGVVNKQWRNSIWFDVLSDLVEEGLVTAEEDADGWLYSVHEAKP